MRCLSQNHVGKGTAKDGYQLGPLRRWRPNRNLQKEVSYKELFTIMINDAIKNFNKDNEMITTMDMSVLNNLKNSNIREFK